LVLVLYGHFVYAAFIERTRHWSAALAVLLALYAPYTLRTLFFEGNLPRILAVLMLPWLVYFVETILIRSTSQRLILASLAWAWTILAHVQEAFIFAIGLGLYCVIRLILDHKIPVRRLALGVGAHRFGWPPHRALDRASLLAS